MASETSEHIIVDFANSNTRNNNTVTASTRFRWNKNSEKFDKIFSKLPKCQNGHKAKMEFSNIFNAKKVQQYEEVRKGMAHINEQQPSYFGPESLNSGIFFR